MSSSTPEASAAPVPAAPRDRTVERVVGWVLYVLFFLVTLGIGVLSIFSVFATDSCGSTGTEDLRVCDGDYFAGALFTFWGALVVIALGTAVVMVVAQVRGRKIWPWPLVGGAAVVLAVVAFGWSLGR